MRTILLFGNKKTPVFFLSFCVVCLGIVFLMPLPHETDLSQNSSEMLFTTEKLKGILDQVVIWYLEDGTPEKKEANSKFQELKCFGDTDSWKTPFKYLSTKNSLFTIVSAGSDRCFGTEDDIYGEIQFQGQSLEQGQSSHLSVRCKKHILREVTCFYD